MADGNPTPEQARAVFQIKLLKEARAARDHYDATGVLQDAATVAPHIHTVWMALGAALNFARPLISAIEQLPKKLDYGGVTFRVIYPPEGLAQLIEPDTETLLTAGFVGWVDPMKVSPRPLTDTDSPPTDQP